MVSTSVNQVTKAVPMPEALRKQKLRNLEREKARVQGVTKKAQEAKAKRSLIAKRAEKYAQERKRQQAGLEELRQNAMANGDFFVEPEAKLAFVIRIRGVKEAVPRVRKVLQLLRLRQVYNGVFVRLNKATLNLLRIAEPYIAWGYPSEETVRNLIYKRGFAKINKQRIPIVSNAQIEEQLGKHDIICVEDLVNQIQTVGPKFREASNFFWPFKLNSPKGGLNTMKNHFVQGGDYGNREEYINDLIARML